MQTAKLFLNGRSQAVRLPREFRMPGKEVRIRKLGSAVVLLPLERSWDSLIESLGEFSGDFMVDRGQPARQRRPRFFR